MSSFNPSANEPRIQILDGFRCIAVLSVIFYHYYFWFSGFKELRDYPSQVVFKYGFLGVHLFFMISGFVIFRSLEQSFSVKQFLGKRYLRLAPSLIVCSIITYVMIVYWNASPRLDMFNVHSPASFLFSFTFINPDIWNTIFATDNIRYIDGAYWSLWPEVIFYISASIVYFILRKKDFLGNWITLVLVLNILRVLTSPKLEGYTPDFLLPITSGYYRFFLFMNITQWVYFTMGVVFYTLWMKREIPRLVWIMLAVLLMMEMYFIPDVFVRIFIVLAIGLWAMFLKKPQWLQFLTWRPFQFIGLISYPLYLLHETAGIVLSEKLILWTNHQVPISVLLLVVLIVIALMAYLIFTVFDKHVTKALKRQLLGIK